MRVRTEFLSSGGLTRRPPLGPIYLRAAALVLLVWAGLLAGQTLREYRDVAHRGIGRLYAAGWMWRQGSDLSGLYDPGLFPAAVEVSAPTGAVESFEALPPAAALFGALVTPYRAASAGETFAWISAAAVLVGLLGLGLFFRDGGDRSEWWLSAAFALAAFSRFDVAARGSLAAVVFLFAAFFGLAFESRRIWLSTALLALLAISTGTGWICLGLLAAWDPRRFARPAAASLVLGISLSVALFGVPAQLAWLSALGARSLGAGSLDAPDLSAVSRWIEVSARRELPGLALALRTALIGAAGLLLVRLGPGGRERSGPAAARVALGLALGVEALVAPASSESGALLGLFVLLPLIRQGIEEDAGWRVWLGLGALATMLLCWPLVGLAAGLLASGRLLVRIVTPQKRARPAAPGGTAGRSPLEPRGEPRGYRYALFKRPQLISRVDEAPHRMP